MPNLVWEKLNKIKLGKYAEAYAKMEFSSYGFEVYVSDVDDHGVDFIIKSSCGCFYEVQVKSIRIDKNSSAEISKDKMCLTNKNFLICFVIFRQNSFPDIYLFSTDLWSEDNSGKFSKLFHTNKTNYSIRPYKNNIKLLEGFKFDKQIHNYL